MTPSPYPLSWIIGSSEFFHSFLFALQKIHSYQIPSQDVLARLLCRLDSALAKIRVLDLLHAHRVSPFVLCTSRLNLFATRTNSLLSCRPSVNPLPQEREFGLYLFFRISFHPLYYHSISFSSHDHSYLVGFFSYFSWKKFQNFNILQLFNHTKDLIHSKNEEALSFIRQGNGTCSNTC